MGGEGARGRWREGGCGEGRLPADELPGLASLLVAELRAGGREACVWARWDLGLFGFGFRVGVRLGAPAILSLLGIGLDLAGDAPALRFLSWRRFWNQMWTLLDALVVVGVAGGASAGSPSK